MENVDIYGDRLKEDAGLADLVRFLSITPSRNTRFGLSEWRVIHGKERSMYVLTPNQPVANYRFGDGRDSVSLTEKGIEAACESYHISELRQENEGITFLAKRNRRSFRFYLRFKPYAISERTVGQRTDDKKIEK